MPSPFRSRGSDNRVIQIEGCYLARMNCWHLLSGVFGRYVILCDDQAVFDYCPGQVLRRFLRDWCEKICHRSVL